MSSSEQQWALEWLSEQVVWAEILDRLHRDAALEPSVAAPYPVGDDEPYQAGPLAA